MGFQQERRRARNLSLLQSKRRARQEVDPNKKVRDYLGSLPDIEERALDEAFQYLD